jgi:arylsulfatase
MKALFRQEARRNNVFPIDDQVNKRAAAVMAGVPSRTFTYWGKNVSVPADHAPRLTGSFRLSAQVRTDGAGAQGVLAALGGRFGGWSFYLKDGHPVVVMAGSTQPERIFRVRGGEPVPAGEATIAFDFSADGGPGSGGLMRIGIDGREVGAGRIEQPITLTTEVTDTFDVGLDSSTPVTDDYDDQGKFNGDIRKLEVRPGA